MKHKLLPLVILSCLVAGCRADQAVNPRRESGASASSASQSFVVLPDPTNALRLRLYTNGSPDAPHLFNTFDIEGDGHLWLQSPAGNWLKDGVPSADTSLHNILVDGEGPKLDSTNSMTIIEQASGPDWRYIALDASAAYRGRLEYYRRSVLFVAPDLFVLHDHLVAKEPARFKMLLHPPAATQVDAIWHDLRLDLPKGGFRIQAPGTKKMPRSWERVESAGDRLLPGTATMQLGPTNKLAKLDLLTVFAVYRGGEKKDYAFKLLESTTAIGARIHRDGLPTLVVFKTDPSAPIASLTGFDFRGPVAVDVFKPKRASQ